jgi:RHS repeat-associated protein
VGDNSIREGGGQGNGYDGDSVRQKFTGQERDEETGLDYFGARYYSSTQGRFTSVDAASSKLVNPQTLNKYRYALNNPLFHTDPDGNQEKKESYVDQLLRMIWEQVRWKGEGDNPNEKPPETIAPGFPQDMTAEQIAMRHLEVFAEGSEVLSRTIMFLDRTGITSVYYELSQENYTGAAMVLVLNNSIKGGRFQDKIHAATGIPENTEKIFDPLFRTKSGGRIPDMIDSAAKFLGEVKSNAKKIELRGNLKDFIEYAAQKGYQLHLYVRLGGGALLQDSLKRELRRINAKVFEYNQKTKTLKEIKY